MPNVRHVRMSFAAQARSRSFRTGREDNGDHKDLKIYKTQNLPFRTLEVDRYTYALMYSARILKTQKKKLDPKCDVSRRRNTKASLAGAERNK